MATTAPPLPPSTGDLYQRLQAAREAKAAAANPDAAAAVAVARSSSLMVPALGIGLAVIAALYVFSKKRK